MGKGLLIPQGGLLGFFQVTLQYQRRNLAANTGGEGDEPLLVLDKKFFIYPRLVVEALKVSLGDQLDEIAVAGIVAGQKDEVVRVFVRQLAAAAAPRGDIDLAADDGFYASLPGLQVQLDGAVENAVVGNGHGLHAHLFSPGDQLRNARHAIEQTVLRMDMKMSKHGSPRAWLGSLIIA